MDETRQILSEIHSKVLSFPCGESFLGSKLPSRASTTSLQRAACCQDFSKPVSFLGGDDVSTTVWFILSRRSSFNMWVLPYGRSQ